MRWIDSERGLAAVVDEASRQATVGIDTEADSLHSYVEKVCLIQLSTATEDWVIDPLAVDPRALQPLLADRSIVKVLHGADYDLRILSRDFGIEIANLVDTMVCAQFAGETAIGLAALLEKFFGVGLDKSHQRADWSKRPLPAAMLEYAARDTHDLVRLAEALRSVLERLGRWDWATEEFARLESIRYMPGEDDSSRYRRLRGAARLDRRGLEILSRLHAWREDLARRRDVPPFKVMGNDALVEIARTRPGRREELEAIASLPRPHLARYQRDLLRIVGEAMTVGDSDLPERIASKPWVRDRVTENRVERLKSVRDRIAKELALEPSVLAPKHLLTAIVTADVRSVADLDAIPAMRQWQKRLLGEALVHALGGSDHGR